MPFVSPININRNENSLDRRDDGESEYEFMTTVRWSNPNESFWYTYDK